MKTKFIKLSVIVFLSIALSACVMAPVQPVGYSYRSTSTTVMPTYVNGQYIGEQPGDTFVQTTTPVYVAPAVPVYVAPAAPVYTYNNYSPYYAPAYVDPWYPVGIGSGVGIGINYFSGCCWRGGYRGGYRGGHRGGHRGGWRR